MLRVPDRDPPCAVDCRDLADLQNRAAHRCVITVIIVDIQKRMGQRAAVERVGIGGVRTDQLRDRVEDQALDDSALLLHQTAVFVNVPDSLRFGIGRGNHVGKSDRPHGRRDEIAGEEFVEGIPDVFLAVPSVLHIHARVLHGTPEAIVVPAHGGVQEIAPVVGILSDPACNRLMILQRGIVIPAVFQLFQRLIQQEPEIVDALIDRVVQRGMLPIVHQRPGHAGHGPVQEVIKLLHRLNGIGLPVRVDRGGRGDGFFHQGHQLRISLQHFLQVQTRLGTRYGSVLRLRIAAVENGRHVDRACRGRRICRDRKPLNSKHQDQNKRQDFHSPSCHIASSPFHNHRIGLPSLIRGLYHLSGRITRRNPESGKSRKHFQSMQNS